MQYIEGIRILVEKSPLFAGKDVHITVIANPAAGGFTIQKRAAKNRAFFEAALESVRSKPVVTKSCSAVLHLTTAAGNARHLAAEALIVAKNDPSGNAVHMLIAAGGDGTSLEVQTALAHAYLEEDCRSLAERICLLRLPFGTGNDGSDGRSLDQSLALLTGESRLERQSAVRVYTSGKKDHPLYAFNIASIGLDAFVTNMTNRVKNKMPGDSYKIWIDLACLFYNRIYRVGDMTVTATKHDGTPVCKHTDQMVLYVMGASGFRTYGSNQKILPDANNVCGVKEMPFLRKLALKKHFADGSITEVPETVFYTADRIVFEYGEKILVQLDGEAHLLGPSDFPLTMELTEPFITVLKPLN